LVDLVEDFYDDDDLKHNYDGLAVSLSQAITTPTVILRELEIEEFVKASYAALSNYMRI
jgi:hypothetical protein